jgi:hypothetical protein
MKTSTFMMALAALILAGSGLFLFSRARAPDYFMFRFPVTETRNTLSEDIAIYEKRTLADPSGALDPATLA